MKKNNSAGSAVRTAAISLLSCVGTVFLCILLCSGLSVLLDLPDGAVSIMSGLSLCAGCFSGAFSAANMRRRHGIAAGFVFGTAVFTAAVLLGIIVVRSFSAGGLITRGIMILCCSAAGGIIGVNTKPLFR